MTPEGAAKVRDILGETYFEPEPAKGEDVYSFVLQTMGELGTVKQALDDAGILYNPEKTNRPDLPALFPVSGGQMYDSLGRPVTGIFFIDENAREKQAARQTKAAS